MSTALSERPKLKQGFSLIPLDESTAMLKSAERAIRMSGPAATHLMPLLVPLLDGARTVDQICAEFAGLDQQIITDAIDLLASHHVLEEPTPPALAASAELSSFYNAVPSAWVQSEKYKSVAESKVLIIAGWKEGELSLSQTFRRTLAGLGVGQVDVMTAELDRAWESAVAAYDLVMYMPEKPMLKVREAVHKACLATKVKLGSAEFLSATVLALGPTVVPGETACWTCYDRRQKGTQDLYSEFLAAQAFLREHPEVDPVSSRLSALNQMLAGLAAFEALRILTNVYPPVTYGGMVTINCVDYALEQHPVLKVPRCPDCSRVKEIPQRRAWSW